MTIQITGQTDSKAFDVGSSLDSLSSRLESSTGTIMASAGAPRAIGGIPIQGSPSPLKPIGGVDRSGRALQGELMFGRTQDGNTLFWLQGTDTNYVLKNPVTGLPVTNAADADARARQLISSGGASRLRPLDARFVAGTKSAGVPGAPSRVPGTLTLDLESSSINSKAGEHRGMFGTGFFVPYVNPDYTSGQAITIAKQSGVPVKQWIEGTKSWHDEPRAHAVVQLSNDGKGGQLYARMNLQEVGVVGRQGTLQMPPKASQPFKAAYYDEARSLGVQQLVATAKIVGYGLAASGGGGRSSVLAAEESTPGGTRSAGTGGAKDANPGEAVNMRFNPKTGSYEADLSATRIQSSGRGGSLARTTQRPTSLARVNQGEVSPYSGQIAAMRPAPKITQRTANAPFNGSIAIRSGVDLSHPGTMPLRSLDAMSKAYGVPKEELRVLVLVRHGESEANAGKRYAGNEVGIQGTDGGFVDPHPQQFTALPTGEVIRPGGQINLTAKGQQQARDVAPVFLKAKQTWGIGQVQVSPVLRARQTFDLATNDGRGYQSVRIVQGLAERGQGSNIGRSKEGSSAPKPGDNLTVPANRPVTDRTGAESVQAFEARIGKTMREQVLPDLITAKDGPAIGQFIHQYTASGQLHTLDPSIDTMEVGHHIPNGQPLVIVFRVHAQPSGDPSLTVLGAGYLRP